MGLRIAILSDIHSEFHPQGWLPPMLQETECDVLVLTGDIGMGDGTIEFVTRVAEIKSDTSILWVAGNHDFYGQDYDRQLSQYRSAFSNFDNVYFLECDTVTIQGVTFLGATLWTGFDTLGEHSIGPGMQVAGAAIADFFRIEKQDGRRLFTPADAAALFKTSRQWLAQTLESCEPGKTVVVTHFPPLRVARHAGFPEDLMSTYFQANCESLIERYQPALWIYGHNHWSDEHQVGRTRLVSNQLGYPGEDGIPGAQVVILEI
ncbi:metallophosphoesterase [Pseudomaricurvus alkylphenolicus]|uniref:metallophosphoesterase n=1 Tax=Pseudomaricurvus alkylphenolicus TaxID=1306991 RepID=UPI0014216E17|nr:metallophosphoesterase [Pseudomaricurvus alkylphenolicus]NIB41601.1 metallophosphoesterase [Pseudomaricurvus alkylphenolicus]